ncbi:MAG: DegV family protein, partial [Culicoidibacterales bacterium]
VIDSAIQILPETLVKYPVYEVSLSVIFGQETYKENIDIDLKTFYARLESGEFATTSQPAPGDFLVVYEDLKAQGYTDILVFSVSSKGSGTYNSATQAAAMMSGINIVLHDTLQASVMAGETVSYIAEQLFEHDWTIEQAIQYYKDDYDNHNIMVAIDNMDHLKRSGRVSSAQALFGSLLSIKPIIEMQDGLVVSTGKQRTMKRALQYIVEQMVEKNPKRIVIMHALNTERKEELEKMLRAVLPNVEYSARIMTPTIGAHSGPTIIGCVWFK